MYTKYRIKKKDVATKKKYFVQVTHTEKQIWYRNLSFSRFSIDGENGELFFIGNVRPEYDQE